MGRKTKSKGTRLVEGEANASRYVTIQKAKKVGPDGKVVVEKTIRPLEEPRKFNQPSQSIRVDDPDEHWEYHNVEPVESSVSQDECLVSSRKKTQKDYILQFVQRVDDFLDAILTRESIQQVQGVTPICQHCASGFFAVWRCCDCSLGQLMCRQCMRIKHENEPLHRFEKWIGNYYRLAESWEVGCYLVIPHRAGIDLCETLKQRKAQIDQYEKSNDLDEQSRLRQNNRPNNSEARDKYADHEEIMTNPDLYNPSDNTVVPEHNSMAAVEEDRFLQYLDALRENPNAELDEPDDDTELGEAETDAHQSMPNRRDAFANPYVRLVHTNGIHHVPMITCEICNGTDDVPADLIASRLLPTSFARIRTLFSAQLLDQFRLCNLELKASAYQFYHLLRRLTRPMDPSGVVDLYNEFRRMTRLWRWMKKLKWAGFAGHNGQKALDAGKGELSNYCPACPQVGINLRQDWEDDPNKFVYRRMFVGDGNFKADHVQPKKPSNDIWLSEGSGMIPARNEYHAFLKTAIEKSTGAPCENTFRAITGAMQASKSCDVTGIVGIACARHGCYAPNSLVDLFKGEQQKNVDFALLAALKSTKVHPKQGLTYYYDVVCQFFVHLKARIGHLLPEGLDIDRAIGLFHVHAHKDDCLFRFSPAFIPGAGCVCGEILESLWSKLNEISPTCRTATLAHRAEMLDDHASDSNHLKALGMAKFLCRKFVEAVETRDCTEKYFEEVSKVASPQLVALWTKQIEDAEARRLSSPKVMDIYAAKGRGQNAELETNESGTSNDPLQAYIQFALMVEEKQIGRFQIRLHVRQITKSPRHADPQKVQALRDRLHLLLVELDRLQVVAGITEVANNANFCHIELLDWADEPAENQIAESDTANTLTVSQADLIEERNLCLPSYGTCVQTLADLEIKARISQANTHLHHIRNLIAEKSFQYSDVIRNAPRKGVRTRSRARVDTMNHEITFYSQLYTNCRARLIQLGAGSRVLEHFQVLKREHVKTSTAVLDPNRPGSTRIRLSWIWHNANQRLGPNIVAENGEFRQADAESGDTSLADTDPETLIEFKRVHWLRARAQSHRWREEATILDYEMAWTVRYFLNKFEWWQSSAKARAIKAGQVAYAHCQAAMWHDLARRADYMFHMTNPSYKKM